jgi:hypothetical protein
MTNDDCTQGPCTQNMTLRGNVIIQGTPQNTSQIVAVFNDNGISGVTMNLTMLWNTIVVSTMNAYAVHLANADGTQMSAIVSNNIISGGAIPILIDNMGKATSSGTNNWLPTGTPVGALTGTVLGASSPFKNAAMKDFTLVMGSNAIGGANGAVMGAPDREYFQNEVMARMYRARLTVKDIGAFESTTMGQGIGPYGMMLPMDGGLPDGGWNPDGGNGSGDGGGNGNGDGGGSGDAGNGGGNGSGGCGCNASDEAILGGWPMMLAILALLRRKR